MAVRIYTKDRVNVGDTTTTHYYEGAILKFLKQREEFKTDYEYQPSGYEDFPILEEAFAAGDVQPGQYLIFPERWNVSEHKIISAYAETVEENVRIRVLFNPSPWALTTDNKPVVRGLGLHIDAGVVEITERLDTKTEIEGRIEFTYHEFSGILINNLTFPDKPIEYEENATE